MSKSILGDDPFAPAGAADERKDPVAEKPGKKKPGKKKEARAEAAAATVIEPPIVELPAVEKAEPIAAQQAQPAAAQKAEPAAGAPPVAPPATAQPHGHTAPAAGSDYGPSIDQPPAPGHLDGAFRQVRDLESRVRERFTAEKPARRHLPLEFLWKRYRDVAMRDRSDVVDEFGRDPQVAAKMDPLLDFLYKSYFRVDAEGMGHIPDAGRALIVANHSGTLPYDGAMIMHAVRKDHGRAVRPLVEDFVFHFPYLGTLMNRIGGVRACQENAERLLEEDQLVAVFPEGIKGVGKLYAQRYQLQRFGRGGFIKLALATDSPIIPTAVVGAEEIHPMLSKVTWLAKSIGIPYIPITPTFPWLGPIGLLPLPTKWFLAFGEPLYFNAEYGAEAANDRILVNKLAEQVRQRIQEMIDGLVKKRRSVFFG